MMRTSTLSRQEWLAVCLWISNATMQQVAYSLGVTPGTARTYLRRAGEKLGVTTQIGLVLAHERGLVRPPDRPQHATPGVDIPQNT